MRKASFTTLLNDLLKYKAKEPLTHKKSQLMHVTMVMMV